jgi:hypothetical protein
MPLSPKLAKCGDESTIRTVATLQKIAAWLHRDRVMWWCTNYRLPAWEEKRGRGDWRKARLDMEHARPVRVSIHYGRRSGSRGDTYTMVFTPGDALGQAVVVPFRNPATAQNAWLPRRERCGKQRTLALPEKQFVPLGGALAYYYGVPSPTAKLLHRGAKPSCIRNEQ